MIKHKFTIRDARGKPLLDAYGRPVLDKEGETYKTLKDARDAVNGILYTNLQNIYKQKQGQKGSSSLYLSKLGQL
jgi:hypothetical protein